MKMIKYTKYGNYLLSNLIVNVQKKDNVGEYGLIILNHFKANKTILYQSLLIQDKLTDYLTDISKDIKFDS